MKDLFLLSIQQLSIKMVIAILGVVISVIILMVSLFGLRKLNTQCRFFARIASAVYPSATLTLLIILLVKNNVPLVYIVCSEIGAACIYVFTFFYILWVSRKIDEMAKIPNPKPLTEDNSDEDRNQDNKY